MPPRPSLTSRLLDLAILHVDRLAALATVAVVAQQIQLVVLLLALPQPTALWRLQLAFTAPRFWSVIADWGSAGMATFQQHFAIDHRHALLYGLWGALVAASSLFDGWPRRRRWLLAATLPAAGMLDLLENGLHLWLLQLPQAASLAVVGPAPAGAVSAVGGPGAAQIAWASGFSLCKWLLVAGFAAVLARRMLGVWGPRLELRVPPLVLLVASAGTMAALAWTSPLPDWRLAWPWAAAPMALGLAIALAGVASFRRARTTVNPLQPASASAMVARGVYRFSRNPMYLGFVLVLAGWALWLGRWWPTAMVPLTAAYLQRFQIRPEEAALSARFGPAYRLYCEQVRRWL